MERDGVLGVNTHVFFLRRGQLVSPLYFVHTHVSLCVCVPSCWNNIFLKEYQARKGRAGCNGWGRKKKMTHQERGQVRERGQTVKRIPERSVGFHHRLHSFNSLLREI